jgi:hypothetical protein
VVWCSKEEDEDTIRDSIKTSHNQRRTQRFVVGGGGVQSELVGWGGRQCRDEEEEEDVDKTG